MMWEGRSQLWQQGLLYMEVVSEPILSRTSTRVNENRSKLTNFETRQVML